MIRLRKKISPVLALIVFLSTLTTNVYPSTSYNIPQPGSFVNVSQKFELPKVRGMEFYSNDPFKFRFIIDEGSVALSNSAFRKECEKIISYFLTALTIPEKDLWVNLSPKESDRIATPELAVTALGEEMLAQDYLLKQLSSSLTSPDSKQGAAYWKVMNGAQMNDMLSKVWISPEKIYLREGNNRVVIESSRLKISTEINSPAFQENIVPMLAEDINNGKNFAQLRQVYASVALANWFKTKLRETAWQGYVNNKKIKGVEADDPQMKEKIYQAYIEAFRKGSYNIMKSERVGASRMVKRRYFAGGVTGDTTKAAEVTHDDQTLLPEGAGVDWSARSLGSFEILTGSWPEGTEPATMAMRIDAAVQNGLNYHKIDKQIRELVATDPSNVLNITFDIGEGRHITAAVPAADKYRSLALLYLTSLAYNNVIWQGRVSSLNVLIDNSAAPGVDTQQIFSAIKDRLDSRYNSGSSRRLQDFGNYGEPVAIAKVEAADKLSVKPQVSREDAEYPQIKYVRDFRGVYLGLDVGGQSTKVAALNNGDIVKLPDALTVVAYPDGVSAQQFSDTLTVHSRKVNEMLIAQYNHGVSGTFYNAAGAFKPDSLGEVAPGIAVEGHAATFATSTDNWTDADKNTARMVPVQVAQIVKSPVKSGNDMVGFASYGEFDPQAVRGTLGTGYGTQYTDSLLSPMEGGHFEILLDDKLPRSGEQLGLSTNAIVNLAKAYGFQSDSAAIKPVDVGMALKDENNPNHAIAKKVFTRVGELLAENLYVMYTITGKKRLILAGGIAQDLTGELLREACNNSQVAKEFSLSLELDPGDVKFAGAIGAAYAASRQMQARIAKMAQSWGVALDRETTAEGLLVPIEQKLHNILFDTFSSDIDLQRAAHDALALAQWGFLPQSGDLYKTAQDVYNPNKDPNRGPGSLSDRLVNGGVEFDTSKATDLELIGSGVKFDVTSGDKIFDNALGCGFSIDRIVR